MPDRINVFLVIVSFALAIALPFELFLFSYAVLGPLHYLTQLHWLREKSFFIGEDGNRMAWAAVAMIIPLSVYALITTLKIPVAAPLISLLKSTGVLIPIAFLLAFFWVVSRKKMRDTTAIAIVVLSFAFYHFLPGYAYIVIALLPTLVHVYLFTLLFVFYGARKSSSAAGMSNAVMLLIVPFALVVLPDSWVITAATAQTDLFSDGDTFGLQALLYRMLGGEQPFEFASPLVIKIQAFIAFAYTYHYLNWFSKTGVIGWTKGLTRGRVATVSMLWIVAVATYWVNFQMGVTLLFFLSLLHVVLEFPLNAVVIKGLINKT
ncbi:MAG: hypothetical protein GC193_10985 [Cryomorphaceae bacterium]|nr:hypothetical protein [Cryomorphaceae bacterium]